jgi:glycine/D-amino acid oxidase-like deaminating enzyme
MVGKTLIIGAGIFGTTIAAELQSEGFEVEVIDDADSESGTSASGFLMKDSWFSSFRGDEVAKAYQLLEDLYGLDSTKFSVEPVGVPVEVQSIRRSDFQRVRDLLPIRRKVLRSVDPSGMVWDSDGDYESFDRVIVAAGYRSKELVRWHREAQELEAKMGVSFEVPGSTSSSRIRPWAPYKQLVAHPIEPGRTWVGDGTAILKKNWTLEHVLRAKKRCMEFLGYVREDPICFERIGVRCMSHRKPALVERISPHVLIATGGGKNGTIAAAWAAQQIVRELKS